MTIFILCKFTSLNHSIQDINDLIISRVESIYNANKCLNLHCFNSSDSLHLSCDTDQTTQMSFLQNEPIYPTEDNLV